MEHFGDLRRFRQCGSFLYGALRAAGAVPSTAPIALVTAMAVLAGCAGGVPTRFYSLEPVPPTAVLKGPYSGPAVQLRAVHIPAAMDRMEILRELAPGQSQVRESDHWAAPLGQAARQALTEDLLARLPPGIVIFPNIPRPAGAAELSVDILAFRVTGGVAVMDVSWNLDVPSETSHAPGSTQQLHLRMAAGSDGAADTAQAFSALLAQLADRIAFALTPPGS